MNEKLIELADRRTALAARAATQRAELSQALAPWRGALEVVEHGLVAGSSGLRGAVWSLARGEMAAAGLAGVEYDACGEANPAWVVSSISRLPPGLDPRLGSAASPHRRHWFQLSGASALQIFSTRGDRRPSPPPRLLVAA